MKKIGIVTIIDNNNYGNRLQNYALYKYLSKEYDVKIVKNSPENELPFCKRYIKKVLNQMHYFKLLLLGQNNLKRKAAFKKFNKKMKFTNKSYSSIKLNDLDFDYYIAGSDQIWNPYHGRLSSIDLLQNVDSNKCLSYAASFGVSKIPEDEYILKIKKELFKFKNISVREEAGKKIIQNLINRDDVEVLIDPTMLLDATEWDQVSLKPKMLKTDKFIFNYFLGDLSESRKKVIEKIAKENNCEIINILDKNSPFFNCGPGEFLYLEKHAFMVCTDSFHSSIFAIIYDRPFIIFDREQEGVESMNSRVDTLIAKFNLKNRKYNGQEINERDIQHDYTEAYKILEIERKKSKTFLEKSLNNK